MPLHFAVLLGKTSPKTTKHKGKDTAKLWISDRVGSWWVKHSRV
jgi:hypothetical protein